MITAVKRDGTQISDNTDQYVEAENGSDLYLTIDVNIQQIAEKYLKEGVIQNEAKAGSAILMDPTNRRNISNGNISGLQPKYSIYNKQ